MGYFIPFLLLLLNQFGSGGLVWGIFCFFDDCRNSRGGIVDMYFCIFRCGMKG